MNRYVIDASALVKLVVPETDSDVMHSVAVAYRRRQIHLLAPEHILVECANVLWKYAARTQTPAAEVQEAFQILLRLGIEYVPQVTLLEAAITLAMEHKRPVYDALYLVLSSGENAPLITADEKMVNVMASQTFPMVLLREWQPP